MVFDTGSDWLVVEAETCQTCTSPFKYDLSSSDTFKQIGIDVEELYYGSATLAGHKVSDRVCLGPGVCTDFEWFLIMA